MSRAFTKEEAPEDPIVVPPRAPLPEGVPNYVTPRGEGLLRAERQRLVDERAALASGDGTGRERSALTRRLAQLDARLARTRVVDPKRQRPATARFGAHVALGAEDGSTRAFQIVGVDEAEPASGRIAFTAPLARAVSGKRVGDAVTLATASGDEVLVVQSVRYGEA